jgi:hypothetical protein
MGMPDDGTECPYCGLILEKWLAKRSREQLNATARPPAYTPPPDPDELSPAQRIIIPAIALVTALLAVQSQMMRFFIESGMCMQVHELGHAVVNWLGGRMAIPLPMFTMIPNESRSVLVALVVAGLLAWLLKVCIEQKCRALAYFAGFLLLAQACMTLILPMHKLQFMVEGGGLAGECIFPALLIIAYFHPLPEGAHWPRARAIFLFAGAMMMACTVQRWHAANADYANVPWGSFFGGDGDVEHMLDMGWNIISLVKFYLGLAHFCAAAALFEYARNVWLKKGELQKLFKPAA